MSRKRPVSLSDAFCVDDEAVRDLPKDAKMSRNLGAMTIASQGPKTYDHARGQPTMYWQQQLSSMRPGESSQPDGSSAISAAPVAQTKQESSRSNGEKRSSRSQQDADGFASVSDLSTPVAGLSTPVAGLSAPVAGLEPPSSRAVSSSLKAHSSSSRQSLGSASGGSSRSRKESSRPSSGRSVPTPLPVLAAASAGSRADEASTLSLLDGKGLFICWICKRRFGGFEVFDNHVLYSRMHQESIRRLAGLE